MSFNVKCEKTYNIHSSADPDEDRRTYGNKSNEQYVECRR